ncbi:MAG: DMT family transporter [Mariprofundaceae bacterium]|nr:DMT family transporter [Mariprofundaceae bacterium]
MLLGTILAFIFAALIGKKVIWHRRACTTYLYAGLGIYGGMIHSASAVWVKRTRTQVSGISMTVGSLMVATPLLLITWALTSQASMDEAWASMMAAPLHTSISIAYLALFGSVFGFSLYFYVLQHVEAMRVALISLMTPITSLMLGHDDTFILKRLY